MNELGVSPERESAIRAIVTKYLEAFAARDTAACVALFGDDALVDFQIASFRGAGEIEAWHAERFAAKLRVLRVEEVRVRGEGAEVDAVVASDRLDAWHIPALGVRIVLRFAAGRIAAATFTPRLNPLDLFRASNA